MTVRNKQSFHWSEPWVNFNWLNETLQLRNNNSGFKFIFFVVHLQVIETSWTPYNNFSASCSNFNAVTAYINWLKMTQPDSMIRYCVSNIASLFSFCLILWAMSVQCHAFPSYILSYDPLNLPDKRLFSFQLYLPSFTDLHSHETPYVLRSPGEPIFRLLVGNWLWRSKVSKPVTFSSCNRIRYRSIIFIVKIITTKRRCEPGDRPPESVFSVERIEQTPGKKR